MALQDRSLVFGAAEDDAVWENVETTETANDLIKADLLKLCCTAGSATRRCAKEWDYFELQGPD